MKRRTFLFSSGAVLSGLGVTSVPKSYQAKTEKVKVQLGNSNFTQKISDNNIQFIYNQTEGVNTNADIWFGDKRNPQKHYFSKIIFSDSFRDDILFSVESSTEICFKLYNSNGEFIGEFGTDILGNSYTHVKRKFESEYYMVLKVSTKDVTSMEATVTLSSQNRK